MAELNLYRVRTEVEDDPAYKSITVLVAAPDAKTARRIAKQGAKDYYLDNAGGWGIAKQTKATIFSCTRVPLEEGVLQAGEERF